MICATPIHSTPSLCTTLVSSCSLKLHILGMKVASFGEAIICFFSGYVGAFVGGTFIGAIMVGGFFLFHLDKFFKDMRIF